MRGTPCTESVLSLLTSLEALLYEALGGDIGRGDGQLRDALCRGVTRDQRSSACLGRGHAEVMEADREDELGAAGSGLSSFFLVFYFTHPPRPPEEFKLGHCKSQATSSGV